LREYLRSSKPAYGEMIRSTKTFDTEAENMLKEAIDAVKGQMNIK
jgi:F-type H+-transporting ATPase subunit alpha